MKTLLYSHLGISSLALILHIFAGLDAAHEFKRRYPDLKEPKKPLIDSIGVAFKAVLLHLIPIMNIALIFVYLFRDEELKERAIKKLYSRLSKEDTDDV